MKLDDSHDLLNALLDGSLDPAGEAAALELLAGSAAARTEFARMAQLHVWLSEDAGVRNSLAALPLNPRRVVAFRAWWVAAAVAAAILVLLAARLWPAGGAPGAVSPPDAPREFEPLLASACGSCHADAGALLRASGERLRPGRAPEEAVPAMLRVRLTGDTPCAEAVSAENRQALLQ